MTSSTGLSMMPWFHGNFLAATQGWSACETGAYFLLLGAQWEMGVLPSDPTSLAAIARTQPREFKAVWRKVGRKFRHRADGWVNDRLEEHRAKSLRLRDAHRAGAATANARIAERNAERGAERNAERSLTEPLGVSPISISTSTQSKRLAIEAVVDRPGVSGLTPGPLVSVNRAVRS